MKTLTETKQIEKIYLIDEENEHFSKIEKTEELTRFLINEYNKNMLNKNLMINEKQTSFFISTPTFEKYKRIEKFKRLTK